MIFWGRQLEYDIYIEKRKVEIVAYYMWHLGHNVTNNINDSLVNDLNIKVNILTYFNDINNKLFKQDVNHMHLVIQKSCNLQDGKQFERYENSNASL